MTTETDKPVDGVIQRIRLYGSTVLVIVAVVTLATGFVVREVTKDVRSDLRAVRAEVSNLSTNQNTRAGADSARFERVMQVVELAVIAIVEPDGSEEQRGAVYELRRKRRVTLQSTRGDK